MGRVLARESVDGRRTYRCSNCGAEREGASEAAICCCGIRFGRGRRDAGIRCVPNPSPTPECPAEIVAVQAVFDAGLASAGKADTRTRWGEGGSELFEGDDGD
jgi:hypothetical protein